MHKTYKYSLSEVPEIAKAIFDELKNVKIITLEGDLGAGKTTLLKELGKLMGIENEISSPSYSIVNEYISNKNEIIYHFDLYRIKSIDEILDIGFTEYIESGNLCFIEWPRISETLLPAENNCKISIEHISPEQRKIEVLFP